MSFVKCAATCAIERVARIARWVGSRDNASFIAWASASGSAGGTSQPVCPSITVSHAPPWFVAIIGRPMAWASTGIRPKPSGSVEAETATVESI